MQDWLGMTAADLGRGIAQAISIRSLCVRRIWPRLIRILCGTEFMRVSQRPVRDQKRLRLRRVRLQGSACRFSTGCRSAGRTFLIQQASRPRQARNCWRVECQNVMQRSCKMRRLRVLVCLGKVHMSEMAFSGLGYNPSTATPPCVNDAELFRVARRRALLLVLRLAWPLPALVLIRVGRFAFLQRGMIW